MDGDLHMFVSEHAAIVIFGGAFVATLIRAKCCWPTCPKNTGTAKKRLRAARGGRA
jgi:hypothetical protein